jgi:predicted N-formylglutamate amidohydrolase
MNQLDENGVATLLDLRSLDDPQEQTQIRLKMEIAIARLLMKIHNDEANDLQAREELATILAKWQGATPEDIREAHEDVEATLAQKHNDKHGLN